MHMCFYLFLGDVCLEIKAQTAKDKCQRCHLGFGALNTIQKKENRKTLPDLHKYILINSNQESISENLSENITHNNTQKNGYFLMP